MDDDLLKHWNYFLALEEDLDGCSQFVDFEESNYSTYSPKFAQLLLTFGSEVDVVAKLLCSEYSTGDDEENINNYSNTLLSETRIDEIKIEIPSHQLSFQPWENWTMGHDGNPVWWGDYNDVKHERNDNYEKANLGNVLKSGAGLFSLLLYCIYEDDDYGDAIRPPQRTNLFEPIWYEDDFKPASVGVRYTIPESEDY